MKAYLRRFARQYSVLRCIYLGD